MPRSQVLIDEPQDAKRIIYISWVSGDQLSAVAHKKLVERLEVSDADRWDRELELVANDPTKGAGEEVAKTRKMRDMATDFIAVSTTTYLVQTKRLGQAGDPDLFCFLQRKGSDDKLAMWIVPVEQVNLSRVGFKDAAIPSLGFPWWHGWRGNDDKVSLPDGSLSSHQRFDSEMAQRVDEILEHPPDCPICKLKLVSTTP